MAQLHIRQNLHIHTHHSCDSACALIRTVNDSMTRFGIDQFGISDHIHTQYNLCDIQSSRNDFLSFCPPPNFHFGVEASCMAKEECDRIARNDYHAWGDEPVYGFRGKDEPFHGEMSLGITAQNVKELGIEYVIGGVHWPLGNPQGRQNIIRHYFNQQKFLLEHPLVHILAHPWYSLELTAGDWYTYRDAAHIDRSIFAEIPQELNDRLGELALQNRKLIEINAACLFSDSPEYVDFLRKIYTRWKAMGVRFTFGSDTHSADFAPDLFTRAEAILGSWGLTENDFSLPF